MQNAKDQKLAVEEAVFVAQTQYVKSCLQEEQAIMQINNTAVNVSLDSKEMEQDAIAVSLYIEDSSTGNPRL